jgi:ABC-2 type transport system permease protein
MSIIRFEWRYHTRQISFYAAALLFFGFGFMLASTGFGPDNVHIDSPYSITQSVAFLSLLSVFVLAVFCANAVVRDRETQMEEIVFTTSVEKLPFLLGRFTGSFLAAFTAFSASVPGMFAGRFTQDADRLGHISILPYLWALLVVALPNLLFAGVVLFALSTITRSVLASYAGSVLIYVLYFVAAALTNSPLMAASVPSASNGPSLAGLLDPFALSAFFEATQHWVPEVRNTRLIPLTGTFLANRLLWIFASAAILAIVYRVFSFRVRAQARRARAEKPVVETPPGRAYAPVAVQDSQWRAYLSATKLEIRSFLLNRPFLVMTLLWTALAAFELVSEITRGEYGSAMYPASGLIFATIRIPLAIVTTILLVYTSAEIVWRERALRIAGILNATPASNAVFVASKVTTLVALVLALTGTGLAAGVALQLASGWRIEPALLLSFAWFLAAPLILFAMLAVVIQALSPHKYFGMMLVLLLAVVAQQGQNFGLEHPLWRFGLPSVGWSDLSRFAEAAGFHRVMLFWFALAALLLVLAASAWRNNRVPRSAILLVAVFAVAGRLLYGAHISSADILDWRAGYEKQYRAYANLPQPTISAITATLDLQPEERRYRVRGEYVLVNDTPHPISKILIAVHREVRQSDITMANAKRTHDARFNQSIFELAQPLAPGATTTARFDITHEPDDDRSVLENGSYVMSGRAFPVLGYRAGYEIDDPRERNRRGLAAAAQRATEAPNWTRVDLTVTTAPDQTVVAPGRLVSAANGTFRFRTDTPIPNQFFIASARYKVARTTHDGVAVEVYYHPAHAFNVAQIERAAAESLQLFTRRFGPYLHDHLRIAEVPAHWNFGGFAQSGVIFLGENRGLLIDSRDPNRLDLVYRRVAHEVAHQWWGLNVVPADVPGASTITESLTKYSELLALEQAHGREEVGQSLAHELDIYLKARTGGREAEAPLMRTKDEQYLYYRKGAIVMYALRDLIGADALDGALRNFLREQGGPGRKPTTTQLLHHIKSAAPPQHHALIDEWMNDVVLYDVKLDTATLRARPDGRFDVQLRVTASKSNAKPIDEQLELGVFAPDGSRLYLAKHAIRTGTQDVTVVVDKQPLTASVDPYGCRIDVNRLDNTKRIEGDSTDIRR